MLARRSSLRPSRRRWLEHSNPPKKKLPNAEALSSDIISVIAPTPHNRGFASGRLDRCERPAGGEWPGGPAFTYKLAWAETRLLTMALLICSHADLDARRRSAGEAGRSSRNPKGSENGRASLTVLLFVTSWRNGACSEAPAGSPARPRPASPCSRRRLRLPHPFHPVDGCELQPVHHRPLRPDLDRPNDLVLLAGSRSEPANLC